MTESYFVSVIIPLYNRESTIERAINSALKQDYVKEIIVIDDGSRDNGPLIVENLSKSYPIIKLIRTNNNNGAAAARNIGINIAKYEYIAFLDSDDEWMENKILLQFQSLQNNPEIDCVYTGVFEINKDLIIKKNAIYYENPIKYLLYWNYIGSTSTCLIKKSALKAVSGFDTSLEARQDLDLWLRLTLNGSRFLPINKPLTFIHLDSDNRISNNILKKIRAHEYFIKKHLNVMIKYPIALSKNYLRLAYFYKINHNKSISKEYYKKAWMYNKSFKTFKNYIFHCILNL
ncbi:MAG: glycosyltransferase family 2 protein [Bacteroidales bacterium]|nr:glycosyltransferase family 2 protein [Bacteroidales bacterium]